MPRFATSITDDRRQSRPLFNPYQLPTDAAPWRQDPELAALVRRISLTTDFGSWGRMGQLALVLGFLVMMFLGLAIANQLSHSVMVVVCLLGIAFMFKMVKGAWAAMRGRSLSGVRATLLSSARCASCAYPLGELAVQPDGCVVCPECGAAWKQERLVRTGDAAIHPPPPDSLWRARPSVRDAAGRIVTLVDPTTLARHAGPHPDSALRADLAVAIRKAALRGSAKAAMFLILISAVYVLPALLVLYVLKNKASIPPYIGRFFSTTLLVTVIALALGLWFYLLWRLLTCRARRTAVAAARALVRHGVCPACGGALTLTARDASIGGPDERFECTTCHAAWLRRGPLG